MVASATEELMIAGAGPEARVGLRGLGTAFVAPGLTLLSGRRVGLARLVGRPIFAVASRFLLFWGCGGRVKIVPVWRKLVELWNLVLGAGKEKVKEKEKEAMLLVEWGRGIVVCWS